uniref:Putative secreted protein n=1 Tax=Anopheles triannulatus TaxID=58253 RepID=A0A2M4B694_9DIPT
MANLYARRELALLALLLLTFRPVPRFPLAVPFELNFFRHSATVRTRPDQGAAQGKQYSIQTVTNAQRSAMN